MALAPPPPLQILATPYLPLPYFITVIRLCTIRAPLIPIGWPKLTAPPFTFTLSGLRSRSFMLASTVAEKASLISWKSIYDILMLARFKAS